MPPAAKSAEHSRLRIAETLSLLQENLPIQRRVLHTGDAVYQSGTAFNTLYIINSGFFKTVSITSDGREQMVGLHLRPEPGRTQAGLVCFLDTQQSGGHGELLWCLIAAALACLGAIMMHACW